MISWSIKRKIFFIISSLGFICFIIALLPYVRILIISITENYFLHRKLNDHDKWYNMMIFWFIHGILFSAILMCCTIFWNKIKNNKILNDALLSITSVNIMQFIKPVLIMFGIYALGISAIIRANFLYIDDIARSMYGFRFTDWSRYLSHFFSIFIHVDTRISDISPLTQLIAAFIIAASSVLLVYIINDKKITKTALAASLPIGLSPYFLECFSWKFDSPYMALSVFVSIVPFIFIKNRLVFVITSITGIIIMCMTYQAASGIYIIVVIILCFKSWNNRQKTYHEILLFLVISVISYCSALILFRIIYMRPSDIGYASTSIYPLPKLISGIVNNIIYYFNHVAYDFNIIWKALLMLLIISFVIKSTFITKQKKLCVIFFNFAILILMAVLSLGIYIILDRQINNPRGMLGVGIFIAILGIYTSDSLKKVFAFPALILCWCFFVFSFSYGNSLAAQKTYEEFRKEMFIHDLAVLFPERSKEDKFVIQIFGWGGYAPIVSNVAVRNPVISRLVPMNFEDRGLWGPIAIRHYNINFQQFGGDIDESEFEQIFDSMYHTIKSDGERVLVILK